jgi:hypothetical protein
VAIFFGMGCSQAASPNDIAVVDALNKWWKESNLTPAHAKAGTVTPAHTITLKNGRVIKIPAHVQTKQEATDEAIDARYMQHRQALIRGFSVKGKTVTAITNLSRDSVNILA